MAEQQQQVEPEKPDNIADDIRAAMAEVSKSEEPAADASPAVQDGGTAPVVDDRPRGPDGKFIAKEPPAAQPDGKDGAASTTPAAAVSSPAPAVEAPQHWPQADRDRFAKLPSDDDRKWWLEKAKSLEDGYQPKFQEIAEIKRAVEPHVDYLKQFNTTPARAFDVLIRTHRLLREGSPEQKTQALMKIAQDFQITLPHGGQAATETPANAEAPEVDQYVQSIVSKVVSPLQQKLETYERAKQEEEQNRIIADITAFQNAKDDAGKPKHPHFAEVADDIAMLAQVERAAGRVPKLDDLYRKACRLNDSVAAKIEAERSAGVAKQREQEAKERAAKATKAGSSVNGSPIGSGTSTVPADSLEEEIRRNYREATGRV